MVGHCKKIPINNVLLNHRITASGTPADYSIMAAAAQLDVTLRFPSGLPAMTIQVSPQDTVWDTVERALADLKIAIEHVRLGEHVIDKNTSFLDEGCQQGCQLSVMEVQEIMFKLFLYPEPWFGGGCSPQPGEQDPREYEFAASRSALVVETVFGLIENADMPLGRRMGGSSLTVASVIAGHGQGNDGPYKVSIALHSGSGQPDMYAEEIMSIGICDAQNLPPGLVELTFGELEGHANGPWVLACHLVEDSLDSTNRDRMRFLR